MFKYVSVDKKMILFYQAFIIVFFRFISLKAFIIIV